MTRTMCSVKQKDFDLCKEDSLKDMLNQKLFTDVTLACNDDKQVDAHRIILSSQSLFFRKILETNKEKDILVYLPNVSSVELDTILEFVYLGQTEICEKDLAKFITFGNLFQIKSLMDLNVDPETNPELGKNILDTGYEGEGLLIN